MKDKVRFTFYGDRSLIDALRDRSFKTGDSVGQLVCKACEAYLDNSNSIEVKKKFRSIEELLKELKTLHEGK